MKSQYLRNPWPCTHGAPPADAFCGGRPTKNRTVQRAKNMEIQWEYIVVMWKGKSIKTIHYNDHKIGIIWDKKGINLTNKHWE